MARRKDHSREELAEMAIHRGRELVIAEGPSALTARNVAKLIGYTPGTLYNLFDNIDELITSINCTTLDAFAEDIRLILSRHSNPRKRIHEICAAYLKLQEEQPHLWTLLFATPQKKLSEDYSRSVHAVFDQVVEAILPLSGSPGNARKDAKIIWSTLHGICLLQQNNKLDVTQIDSPELLVKRFLAQFFK